MASKIVSVFYDRANARFAETRDGSIAYDATDLDRFAPDRTRVVVVFEGHEFYVAISDKKGRWWDLGSEIWDHYDLIVAQIPDLGDIPVAEAPWLAAYLNVRVDVSRQWITTADMCKLIRRNPPSYDYDVDLDYSLDEVEE